MPWLDMWPRRLPWPWSWLRSCCVSATNSVQQTGEANGVAWCRMAAIPRRRPCSARCPPWMEVEGKDRKMLRQKKCKKHIKSYLAINQRQQNMSNVLRVQIVNKMLIYLDASGGTFFVGLAYLMSSPEIQKSSETCHCLLFVGFLSSDCFLFWQPNLVIFRPRRLPHNIPTCSIHFETTCSLETYF